MQKAIDVSIILEVTIQLNIFFKIILSSAAGTYQPITYNVINMMMLSPILYMMMSHLFH